MSVKYPNNNGGQRQNQQWRPTQNQTMPIYTLPVTTGRTESDRQIDLDAEVKRCRARLLLCIAMVEKLHPAMDTSQIEFVRDEARGLQSMCAALLETRANDRNGLYHSSQSGNDGYWSVIPKHALPPKLKSIEEWVCFCNFYSLLHTHFRIMH